MDMKNEGRWDQLRGKARETWGFLTDDELDQTRGKVEQLIGKIKERTGESTEAIKEKLGVTDDESTGMTD